METYLISIDVNEWNIVTTKYVVPTSIPSDPDAKTQYELNARAKHALLCGLTKDVFVKVMHCAFANEIWSKLETIYQVVNSRRGLGENVDEKDVVRKVIRTLLPKYETKVSTLEEKKSFSTMSLDSLQSILTAYEMRIGSNSSNSKETAFKVEKKEEPDSESELSDAIEALLVRKLKKKYKGKLPFKCFNCGDETLFMAEIETSSRKDIMNISEDKSDDLDQGESDLEGELLCALKEIKRLKKLVVSHESEIQILQIELKDSKQTVEDLKVLLADSELKVNTLEQQTNSLHKQIEQYESTLHLNEILNKQKLCKNMTGVGFESAKSAKQITKPTNRNQF
ncbi:uncharacterized protein LOC131874268 [Cryptomeria japonica]|uniref:uncharacterized protein LOC131874268 n=1 Tax=Cryptomeria japonica TaxID=3369 RepID=UPI0027DA8AD0|nr:uncharacterized protein LOC131874268 [Cryptomeria japonica]